MEGKLYKDNDIHYYLIVDGKIIADSDGHPLSSITNKLSLKNCQAIERGYDLDELAREFCHPGNGVRDNFQPVFKGIFIQGFQKALELLGDKKFSEEDMKSFAQNYYREIRENKSNLLWSELADKCLEEHIQSLQQTEWDVEIVMEDVYDGLDEMAQPQYSKQPKLDADGCLILKRI